MVGVLADFVQRNAESVAEHIWFRIDSDEERAVTLRTHDEFVAQDAMGLESPDSANVADLGKVLGSHDIEGEGSRIGPNPVGTPVE